MLRGARVTVTALRFVFERSTVPYAIAVNAQVAFIADGSADVWRTRLDAWASTRVFLATRAAFDEVDLASRKSAADSHPVFRSTAASCSALRLSPLEGRLADRVASYSVWNLPVFERADWHGFAERMRLKRRGDERPEEVERCKCQAPSLARALSTPHVLDHAGARSHIALSFPFCLSHDPMGS